MAIITFNCPECQQPIEAPDEMAGEVAACPTCEKEIVIPKAGVDVQQAASNACVSCGAAMEEGAVLCLQCGYHSVLGKKIQTEF